MKNLNELEHDKNPTLASVVLSINHQASQQSKVADIQDDPRVLKAIVAHKLRNKREIIKQEQKWISVATILYGAMAVFIPSTILVITGIPAAGILSLVPVIGTSIPILRIIEEGRIARSKELLEISKFSDQELKPLK